MGKVIDETMSKIEESMKEINDAGINAGNIKNLSELVDMYKDIKEVECMQYGNYGNYEGYRGPGYDNYGRDAYGDSYGRRGYDMKYRGESALDAMRGNYRAYSEGKEAYGRGNYGAKEDSMKSLKFMLENAVDFFKMLKADANSQEELTLIHDYVENINKM